MEVVCVGHAIKEVMTAGESLECLVMGAEQAGATVAAKFMVSDGGDGFLDAYEAVQTCIRRTVSTTGPLGDSMEAEYVLDEHNKIAIIESARACGLALVEPQRRNIMISGTAGLADLIANAREAGATKILIGLGGSATCDGGVGLLWRLAELTGKCQPCENEFRIALDMAELSAPDLQLIRDWLGDIELIACVDVDNPLLGERGAARTFASQKGATPEEVEQLEGMMGDWAQRIERGADVELREVPGSGAAGGLGFALAAIGATIEPGGLAFCRWSGLDDKLKAGNIVATVEGKFDQTSFGGKAPWSVATVARDKQATPVIMCGAAESDAVDKAAEAGVSVVEFAPILSVEARKEQSPALLTETFSQYLQSVQSKSV